MLLRYLFLYDIPQSIIYAFAWLDENTLEENDVVLGLHALPHDDNIESGCQAVACIHHFLNHTLDTPLIHPKHMLLLKQLNEKKSSKGLETVTRILHGLSLPHQAILHRLLIILSRYDKAHALYRFLTQDIFRMSCMYGSPPRVVYTSNTKVLTYLVTHKDDIFSRVKTGDSTSIRGFVDPNVYYLESLPQGVFDLENSKDPKIFETLELSLLTKRDIDILVAGGHEIRLEAGTLLSDTPIQSILYVRSGNLVLSKCAFSQRVHKNQSIEEPSIFAMTQGMTNYNLSIHVDTSGAALITTVDPDYLVVLANTSPCTVARFFFEMSYKVALKCYTLTINQNHDIKTKRILSYYNLHIDNQMYNRTDTNNKSEIMGNLAPALDYVIIATYDCFVLRNDKTIKATLLITNYSLVIKMTNPLGIKFMKNVLFEIIEDLTISKNQTITICLISKKELSFSLDIHFFEQAYNLIFKLWKSTHASIYMRKELHLTRKRVSVPFSEFKLDSKDWTLILDETESPLTIEQGKSLSIRPNTIYYLLQGQMHYTCTRSDDLKIELKAIQEGSLLGPIEYFTKVKLEYMKLIADSECHLVELNLSYLKVLFASDLILASKFYFLTAHTLSKMMCELCNKIE